MGGTRRLGSSRDSLGNEAQVGTLPAVQASEEMGKRPIHSRCGQAGLEETKTSRRWRTQGDALVVLVLEDEPVSDAGNGHDIAWRGRIGLDFPSQS
jgi:hypothetical protein